MSRDGLKDERQYAHQIVPHPGEGEAKPIDYLVRYHYAQAQAWHLAFSDALDAGPYGPEADFALSSYMGHAHRALLFDALCQGKQGQEVADWAAVRNHSESAEWIWERGVAYGLDPTQIRPYKTRRESSVATARADQ